jgi:hypothetical protein
MFHKRQAHLLPKTHVVLIVKNIDMWLVYARYIEPMAMRASMASRSAPDPVTRGDA